MIDVQKQQKNKSIAVIRAATGYELSEYEKKKLEKVEEGAQKNKIESIRVDGVRVPIDSATKTALIDLNLKDLAFKSAIGPKDIDQEDTFFIKCEL
jgi:hypothetical protein